MNKQIITQVLVSLTLAFIGHYVGLNIMISVGFGLLAGLIISSKYE